jgi:hypothetical protein
MAGRPARLTRSYPALALITDPAWIISIRYHREGGQDWGVYLGACVFLYLNFGSSRSYRAISSLLPSKTRRATASIS